MKQNWDLREAHENSLKEMKELKKFQSSTFNTIARRRLVEYQDAILELTGKIHDLQNEINCMNDSRYFQDAESVRSGHSHVTSQPVSFPPHPIPGGMLSRSIGMPSRKEGPPSIWVTHGKSGNVFAGPYPQELNPWSSHMTEPIRSSSSLSVVLFLFTFYFLLYFTFLLCLILSMTDNDSMNLNTLCNFANGTFVTLDECLPDTGYEPNAMELTDVMAFAGTTELNDAASSDINFQDSLDYTAPSSDPYIDDDALGKLLAEVHRDCADYRRAEGVSVSPSSVSVMVDRTGEPVERSDSDHFPCSVRNVKSAQNQFPVITQAKRMVDRTGEPVEEMIAKERESSSAQIRTMLNEQRKTIIAEYCEKVSHHELLAAQAEHERRILQEELLRQNRIFMKFTNKIL